MTIKNADMPAMPLTDEQVDNFGSISSSEFCGLTKREQFAAMAMQGLKLSDYHNAKDMASDAIMVADELLKQLEQVK